MLQTNIFWPKLFQKNPHKYAPVSSEYKFILINYYSIERIIRKKVKEVLPDPLESNLTATEVFEVL